MAFKLDDRARETSTAPGTGAFTVNGAVQGAQSLASVLTVDGDTSWYAATNGTAWETGLLTRTSAGVYARTTIFASSNSGSAVNFAAGLVDIFLDFPASRLALLRKRLTANLTLYVRPNGLDTNDGTANTGSGAFLTRQKAWDTLCDGYDLNGFPVIIQLAAGTYTDAFDSSKMPVGANGPGSVTFLGDASTPANVLVSTTSASCFAIGGGASGYAQFTVNGMELRTATSGNCLEAFGGSSGIEFANIRFGACAGDHILANHAAFIIYTTGTYAVVGGAVIHIASLTGACVAVHGAPITFANAPAFTYVLYAQDGQIYAAGAFADASKSTVTGAKYVLVGGAASLNIGSDSASYLPGNSAGATASGPLNNGSVSAPSQGITDSSTGVKVAIADSGVAFAPAITASGGIIINVAPTAAAAFDASGAGTTVILADGASSAILALSRGRVTVAEVTATGDVGVYLVSNNAAKLSDSALGSYWVTPTTTPAAGKGCVAFDGATGFKIYNHSGVTSTFHVIVDKLT